MSEAEHADVLATGALRAGPNSFETGKWFAESAEHAVKWGNALDGPGKFRVLQLEFPSSAADQFFRLERLDGIGPARFGTFDQIGKPNDFSSAGDTMTQQAKARLTWMVPLAPDGAAPRGRRFSVPAKFDHQGADWTSNAWSLVVEGDTKPDARGMQEVHVQFLIPNGPVDWLVRGRKFTLHEGRTRLAEGEIL